MADETDRNTMDESGVRKIATEVVAEERVRIESLVGLALKIASGALAVVFGLFVFFGISKFADLESEVRRAGEKAVETYLDAAPREIEERLHKSYVRSLVYEKLLLNASEGQLPEDGADVSRAEARLIADLVADPESTQEIADAALQVLEETDEEGWFSSVVLGELAQPFLAGPLDRPGDREPMMLPNERLVSILGFAASVQEPLPGVRVADLIERYADSPELLQAVLRYDFGASQDLPIATLQRLRRDDDPVLAAWALAALMPRKPDPALIEEWLERGTQGINEWQLVQGACAILGSAWNPKTSPEGKEAWESIRIDLLSSVLGVGSDYSVVESYGQFAAKIKAIDAMLHLQPHDCSSGFTVTGDELGKALERLWSKGKEPFARGIRSVNEMHDDVSSFGVVLRGDPEATLVSRWQSRKTLGKDQRLVIRDVLRDPNHYLCSKGEAELAAFPDSGRFKLQVVRIALDLPSHELCAEAMRVPS